MTDAGPGAWERIRERQRRLGTFLCVGLDPDPDRIPAGQSLEEFCLGVMEATAPFACAFKPNSAFFEAAGLGGWRALFKVISYSRHLGVPAILDAKRGDIGNTARFYAKAAFDELGADAITVSPYLGREAIIPFLAYNQDALTFVLCATSNPGAAEIQGAPVERDPDANSPGLLGKRSTGEHTTHLGGAEPLYLKIARLAASLAQDHPNIGLVVGATKPELMREIREAAPDLPWLVPGIGAQGGDMAAVAKWGGEQVVFNASRAVIHAPNVAVAARELRDAFNRCR